MLLLLLLSFLISDPGTADNPALSPSASAVPGWAKSAVWYQIFPERFRNGEPKNDPAGPDLLGAWPHQLPDNWHVSPWTSDWYKLQPWEQGDGKGFYFNAQLRRYGGDLQGILDKLDYLQSLGVTALYLNPIFESPSLHKYDAAMYHHVDNNFGPNPQEDAAIRATENPADPASWRWTSADSLFLSLVREVHRRNMKIILDGVFNHVGTTFWAFKDVHEKGIRSQFKDWFSIVSFDDPSTAKDEFEYQGWAGVKDLPEFKRDSAGLASGPTEHIHAIVKRWMDPNGDGNSSDGIDGWRLDVADKVPMGFWRLFRTWVRGINPEAYITGEVWWDDWGKDKMFNAEPWLRGDAFDAVMNYRWAREACRFFKDKQNAITPSEFARRLDSLRKEYRQDVNYVLMNLLDSHDTDRLGSMIVNPDTKYDHQVGASDNRSYDVRKPNSPELRIQKLMVLFQMTYLGAPMVYYGDEAGMWGGDDPDERKPMLWRELNYEAEASDPYGRPRPVDSNEFNRDLFDWYKKLIHIRVGSPALRLGSYSTLLADDHSEVLGFARSWKDQLFIVLINNSDEPQTVDLRLPPKMRGRSWLDVLSSDKVAGKNGIIRVKIEGKTGTVLEGKRK